MRLATARAADLVERGGRVAYEVFGLSLVWLGVAVLVYVNLTDPRGLVRRATQAYVAGLDARLASMFMAANGRAIAAGQGALLLALGASYAFFPTVVIPWAVPVVVLLPPWIVRSRVQRRQRRLDGQVHGFAGALANALKTTASLGDAFWVTLDVTDRPLREEMETMLKQIRVGSSLEDALLGMAERARSGSLDVVVSALLIGRQTGGDLPRILEGTSASLREMKRLEELTAREMSGAKQGVVLAAAVTAGLVIAIPRIFPPFFDPLRDTPQGQLVAAQCALAYVFALYLGYRFSRSDI